MRVISNIVRCFIILSMGGLMGWYLYQEMGLISIFVSVYYTAIGWFLSRAWVCPENKKCEERSEMPVSDGTATDASVVEPKDTTDNLIQNEPTLF